MPSSLVVQEVAGPKERKAALMDDVARGLSSSPKQIPPAWFYDETGSLLFDEITRLDEYYLTRAERSILERYAPAMTALAGCDTLVEIGSGTSEKTLLLLEAMSSRRALRRIVLLDISGEVLIDAARRLGERYQVEVHAIIGDFSRHVDRVPAGGRRLWAFLGGTIGNFRPEERAGLLASFASHMARRDCLLLGADLVKDEARLLAAYDDPSGVTAAFNRNVLEVLNRELEAGFDPLLFEHHAVWNRSESWIEMRLRASVAHEVKVGALGLVASFEEGEEILTEISAKFTAAGLAAELEGAGLELVGAWQDEARDFQLTLATKPA